MQSRFEINTAACQDYVCKPDGVMVSILASSVRGPGFNSWKGLEILTWIFLNSIFLHYRSNLVHATFQITGQGQY